MRCFILSVLFAALVRGEELPVLSGVVNGFAVDVYQKVEKEGDFCYSPYALHSVLSMVEVGAEKRTRDELYGVLKLMGERGDAVIQHANLYEDMVQRYTRGLPKQLDGKEDPVDLFLLNRIYLRAGGGYDAEYLEVGRDVVGYGMEQKDFQKEHELIRVQANAWVAEESFQRVNDALPKGAVTEETSILLVNGLFFQAPWHMPFDPKLTKPGVFYRLDGSKMQVPMIQREGKYGYLANSSWTAVSMPFGQYSECQLVLMIPKAVDGLRNLERLIKAKDLMGLRELPQRTVKFSMPRFELKGESVNLRPVLMELGVKRAFNEPKGSAELTRIDVTRKVSLGSIHQKSYFKIDERGCDVVRAADAALLERVLEQPTRGFELKADRPFMFFLQDCRTGMVLLMGRVVSPSE